MSVSKTNFIKELLNPGVAWTRSYAQMMYYLVYDLLLPKTALSPSSILVNLSRLEPGKRWGSGFHPRVMDDMSPRQRGWCMLRVGHNVSPSPAKAIIWLIDFIIAKAPQSNLGPFTAQHHWKLSHTPHFFRGKRYFTEGNCIGASLLYRSKQPLDHIIMGKEDKHTPPCYKSRLLFTTWGYRDPVELLNGTKLIHISAQQLQQHKRSYTT